jgi:hypothetical protein
MKKLLEAQKRGFAVPLAIVALLILLAMGTGLLSLGLNRAVSIPHEPPRILQHDALPTHRAVVAKNFTIKNNGIFYYDAALGDVSVSDEGVRFVIKRWYEGEPK